MLMKDRHGNVFNVGADGARMFVGGDRQMLLGEDMILGQDGSLQSLASEVQSARSTGGFVSTGKQPSPVAFYQMLPFTQAFTASQTLNLSLFPQRTFRVDNLIVTSPEGPFFQIEAWNVGQQSMFVADGAVNCAAFSEAAAQRGLGLRGFTANQGAQVNLRFTNLDTEAHTLSGMLAGPAMIAVG